MIFRFLYTIYHILIKNTYNWSYRAIMMLEARVVVNTFFDRLQLVDYNILGGLAIYASERLGNVCAREQKRSESQT